MTYTGHAKKYIGKRIIVQTTAEAKNALLLKSH
jgi:hypothetical protein